MRAIVPLALVLLLASCATPEPVPPPQEKTVEPEKPAAVTEKKPRPNKIESQPLKHLAGRKLKPIPDKELDVKTRCSFKDVQGGRGSMDLQVTKAEVKRFVAEVTIAQRSAGRLFRKSKSSCSRNGCPGFSSRSICR